MKPFRCPICGNDLLEGQKLIKLCLGVMKRTYVHKKTILVAHHDCAKGYDNLELLL